MVPQHREVGIDHLVGGRQIHPDLEQLEGVGRRFVEQGEHLGVLDPTACGHPLDVATPVAGRRAERVGVVDEPLAHERDRLEPPVGVLREAGDVRTVVHPPAVDGFEVVPDRAAVQRRGRPEATVGGRVRVEVVDAEQERVDRRPLEAEGDGLDHRGSHAVIILAGASFQASPRVAATSSSWTNQLAIAAGRMTRPIARNPHW